LEDMLRAIGLEILLQKRGLQNLERVKIASKETVYSVNKGCLAHCKGGSRLNRPYSDPL
jgi:hypothetical protein